MLENWVKRNKKELVARIEHLEDLVEKAAIYIKNVDKELKELREDRDKLLADWEKLVYENKKIKLNNTRLERENNILNTKCESYRALFVDMVRDLDNCKNTLDRELANQQLERLEAGIRELIKVNREEAVKPKHAVELEHVKNEVVEEAKKLHINEVV